jgi:hypothetical protein
MELDTENATRLGPIGMEVTRLMNFAFRGMLNHGVVPRLAVRSRGKWKRASAVELIHDHWPGRPSSRQDSAVNRVSNEIWEMYRQDNLHLDEKYRLGLSEFGYY